MVYIKQTAQTKTMVQKSPCERIRIKTLLDKLLIDYLFLKCV